MAVIWGRREAECFSRQDRTGGIALMWLKKLAAARKPEHLIHRNPTPSIGAIMSARPKLRHARHQPGE
jgi:hypothetical protein